MDQWYRWKVFALMPEPGGLLDQDELMLQAFMAFDRELQIKQGEK